jgi:hypothetical protein
VTVTLRPATHQQTESQHLPHVVAGHGVAANDVDEDVAEGRQHVAVGLAEPAAVAGRVVAAADAQVVEEGAVQVGSGALSGRTCRFPEIGERGCSK